MVSLKQVIAGVLEYAQQNIVANMPAKSPKRLGFDIAIGLLQLNIDNTCQKVKSNEYYAMVKQFGIVDDNDMVDLDKAIPVIQQAMQKDGLEYVTKSGDQFAFDVSDIDSLVKTIKSIRV